MFGDIIINAYLYVLWTKGAVRLWEPGTSPRFGTGVFLCHDYSLIDKV
jgi:hypothetical protein